MQMYLGIGPTLSQGDMRITRRVDREGEVPRDCTRHRLIGPDKVRQKIAKGAIERRGDRGEVSFVMFALQVANSGTRGLEHRSTDLSAYPAEAIAEQQRRRPRLAFRGGDEQAVLS